MSSEYPKMLTAKIKGANGFYRDVAVYYRRDHPEKGGQIVIFQSAKDEKAYRASDGVIHSGEPEQHSQPAFDYSHAPPRWVGPDAIHQRRKGEVA
jgi:hypothetical protein